MPRWITVGLITSFAFAGLYGWIHQGFDGPGWKKGLLYGAFLSIVWCLFLAGLSGVFNLPEKIWAWWGIESFFYNLPGGAVLGWLHEKYLS